MADEEIKRECSSSPPAAEAGSAIGVQQHCNRYSAESQRTMGIAVPDGPTAVSTRSASCANGLIEGILSANSEDSCDCMKSPSELIFQGEQHVKTGLLGHLFHGHLFHLLLATLLIDDFFPNGFDHHGKIRHCTAVGLPSNNCNIH